MSSMATSLIVFAVVFAGALFGMFLRAVLPKDHLSSESKDVVKMGMGIVATISALVLGLLISEAKGSYDAQSAELTAASSKIILLDRALAYYGPEAKRARDMLRTCIAGVLDRTSLKYNVSPPRLQEPISGAASLYDNIQGLVPRDDRQRLIQAEALSMLTALGQTRWLMFEQESTSISLPFLVILVSWLTALFITFGLFAPPNATVVTALFVSALSVSGAVLLILELYAPYAGLIRISSAPLRAALIQLGK
jgi:UDP-N-acetylmuramyl pentapeptide phosphotransferase/UDP-N-acetylglucosamine-1-phosphate transferase